MRISRAIVDGKSTFGVVGPEGFEPLDRPPWDAGTAIRGPHIGPLDSVEWLAPVAPSKIVATGNNYPDGDVTRATRRAPRLFMKPPTSVVASHEAIVWPATFGTIVCEAELAVVMASRCFRVSPSEGVAAIFGCTIINDVTAADLIERDGSVVRAKLFDTATPVGPWIECDVSPDDGLRIETRVNGVVAQRGSTADMLFSVGEVISYISQVCTLMPGDVVSTGTPMPIPSTKIGDVVECEIEGIGVLVNPIVADEVPVVDLGF